MLSTIDFINTPVVDAVNKIIANGRIAFSQNQSSLEELFK